MKNKNNFDLEIILSFRLKRKMCRAITKSGKVCKVKGGDCFCHIHAPYIEPTIEEKREAMLQKLLNDPLQPQVEAFPLFKDIDLTSETLDIIKRAKYICNWSDETYNEIVSTYFDDGVDSIRKYVLIRDKICEGMETRTKDSIICLQRIDIYRDLLLLYIKVAMSRRRIWFGLEEARKLYKFGILQRREHCINKYREDNLNKLRLNELKKYTPICDDVRKYIIAEYL